MKVSESIKSAIERSTMALARRPSLGRGTGISTTRIVDGLTCQTQEGDWKFVVDMPESAGGNAKGPTPGVLGRAALGSCLAIGYMMQAAKMEVPVTELSVTVEADYDDGALFGTSAADPGYLEVRYLVTVTSPSPEETILRMLDEADRHSPYLDVFSRAQTCKRSVEIVSPKPT